MHEILIQAKSGQALKRRYSYIALSSANDMFRHAYDCSSYLQDQFMSVTSIYPFICTIHKFIVLFEDRWHMISYMIIRISCNICFACWISPKQSASFRTYGDSYTSPKVQNIPFSRGYAKILDVFAYGQVELCDVALLASNRVHVVNVASLKVSKLHAYHLITNNRNDLKLPHLCEMH